MKSLSDGKMGSRLRVLLLVLIRVLSVMRSALIFGFSQVRNISEKKERMSVRHDVMDVHSSR